MEPIFFKDSDEFRTWLIKNHQVANELQVGFYKVKSKKKSMVWSEAVDEALCFGWIDSVMHPIDEESYALRFTPRKAKSTWSTVNIHKVAALSKLGKMYPAGIAAFERRSEKKSGIYAYENAPLTLSNEFQKLFESNAKAWDFFKKQAPSYQRTAIYRIMGAKQEQTKLNRLNAIIAGCEAGKKV